MSRAFTIIAGLFFWTNTHAQHVAVETRHGNILYAGLDNLATIVVENSDCKSLVVRSSGKIIKKLDCTFILTPDSIGPFTIYIYQRKGRQLIKVGDKDFKVKRMDPLPLLHLEGHKPRMTIDALCKAENVHLYIEGLDWDPEPILKIESFTTSIFSKDSIQYFKFYSFGKQLDSVVRQRFCLSQPGDFIRFSDIRVRTTNKFPMVLEDQEVKIVH